MTIPSKLLQDPGGRIEAQTAFCSLPPPCRIKHALRDIFHILPLSNQIFILESHLWCILYGAMVDMWLSSSLYLCHTKGARHMSETVAEITGGLGFKRTSQVIASSWVSLWCQDVATVRDRGLLQSYSPPA